MNQSYKKYTKQQILKEIYDHTINQKKQEGILSTIQLREILHVLNRDDIQVIDEIDYWKKAINNNEPKEAIIFHHNLHRHEENPLSSLPIIDRTSYPCQQNTVGNRQGC